MKLICSRFFEDSLTFCIFLINYVMKKSKKKAIYQQTYVQLQVTFQLQVAILYHGTLMCGGAIISPDFVVTAASCVAGYVCT
jgi:secreted trypsin-like serine protease